MCFFFITRLSFLSKSLVSLCPCAEATMSGVTPCSFFTSNRHPAKQRHLVLEMILCYIHWRITLWFQLEDMFQLIITPQGIEKVTIQLKDTPTKVYAVGAKLFLLKVPLDVLQNWILIQLKDMPHIFENVLGLIIELFQIIEPCLLIGTGE